MFLSDQPHYSYFAAMQNSFVSRVAEQRSRCPHPPQLQSPGGLTAAGSFFVSGMRYLPRHEQFPKTVFVPTPYDQLPRDDPKQTGTGFTFKTLEHDEHNAPYVIEATDAEGRSCVYVPLRYRGKIGRWTHT